MSWFRTLAGRIVLVSLIAVLLIFVTRHFLITPLKPGSPNVVWITIDTVRSDHCSSYGYARQTTPHMDQFAGEGALFEVAYAPMPQTTPSHATMLTSQYPISHGVVKNGYTLDPSSLTLPEMLKQKGYSTAAVVSAFPLNSKFGLSQGFDVYEDEITNPGTLKNKQWAHSAVEGGFDRIGESTTQLAKKLLDELTKKKAPFFLWIHYFDPHGPYVPPAPYDRLFVPEDPSNELETQIAAYDGEIRYTDEQIGIILNELKLRGLEKNTLVMIVGDHGEGLMEHGRMDHGHMIYEEEVRAPFIVRWSGKIPSGQKIQAPVQFVDLMPTVLDFLDIPKIKEVQGVSLAPRLLDKGPLNPNRPVLLQRRSYGDERGEEFGLRIADFKLIEAPSQKVYQLYNLIADSDERNNLYSIDAAKAKDLAAVLHSMQEKYGRNLQFYKQDISDEDQERLKALGYVQ